MTNTPAGWDGILDDDEEILWQGRPDRALIWPDLISKQTFIGVFFCIVSAFWLGGVWSILDQMGDAGAIGFIFVLFPLFGAAFFVVGLYMLGGRLFWDAYARGFTWYTLTSKGAYIATALFGRRGLKHYAFADMDRLDLEDGQPGTIWFSEDIRIYRTRTQNGNMRTRTQRTPVGFRRIAEARAVYRMISDRRDQIASQMHT